MFLPRIVAALIAAACGLTLREITQSGSGIAGLSLGRGMAAAAVGAAMLAAVVMVVAPRTWWERLLAPINSARQSLLAADPPQTGRIAAWLLVVAGAAWTLMLIRHLALPQDPWDDDQGAFLITAREIHDSGGIGGLVATLFAGEFAEANRHPLYLALLSIRPTFEFGKGLSAAIGTLTLVLLTLLLGRKRGWQTAGVFAVLLATNSAFSQFSSTVVCDVLMLLLGGLIWLLHLPQLEALPESQAVTPRRRMAQAATAGGMLGLAWLTKGTGLVLLGGYLLWLLAAWLFSERRARAESDQLRGTTPVWRGLGQIACVTLAFVIVAGPLLIRNVRRYNSPFHNINSLLLFADRYEDLEPMLRSGVTTGEAARNWLATHDAGDILRRELSGLIWELFIILRSLGPAPLDDARVLIGVPLAICAALWMFARRSAADGLLLVWGLVCWSVFAWYVPIAAGERFIVPLLVPLLATAAEGIVRGAQAWRIAPRPVVAACGIWAVVWTAAAWLWTPLL
jgi:hypothetical protein